MLTQETATAPAEQQARWRDPAIAWVLLLITSAQWGAIGPVGGWLAVLKLIGFAAAIVPAFLLRPKGQGIGVPAWLLIAYAGIAAVGAHYTGIAAGDSWSRSARYVLVVATAALIAARWTLEQLLRATALVATAVAALGLLGHYAGLSGFIDGRLTGWLPPLSPNSLGALASIGAISVAVLWLRRQLDTRLAAAGFIILICALLLTQSRTGVIATAAGLAIALAIGDAKRSLGVVFVGALTASSVTLLAFLTNSDLSPFRGSRFQWDSSFSGRTKGWARVAELARPWPQPMFGNGLAAKYVPDPSVALGIRPIDGSWHSAYYEAGLLGLVALAAAVALLVIWAALSRPGRVALPILGFLVLDALLESDLNDVTFPLTVLAGLAGVFLTFPRQTKVAGQPRADRPSYGPAVELNNLAWFAITVVVVAAAVLLVLLAIGI